MYYRYSRQLTSGWHRQRRLQRDRADQDGSTLASRSMGQSANSSTRPPVTYCQISVENKWTSYSKRKEVSQQANGRYQGDSMRLRHFRCPVQSSKPTPIQASHWRVSPIMESHWAVGSSAVILKDTGVTWKTYLVGTSDGTGSQWIATLNLKVGIGHHTAQAGHAVYEELRQDGHQHRPDMDKRYIPN